MIVIALVQVCLVLVVAGCRLYIKRRWAGTSTSWGYCLNTALSSTSPTLKVSRLCVSVNARKYQMLHRETFFTPSGHIPSLFFYISGAFAAVLQNFDYRL